MDTILDGLFISNYRDARDIEYLHRNKITHIVKLLLFAKPITMNHHYLCIRVADHAKVNISKYFAVCNDFIHDARLNKNNVLIHCFMGISRSVTIAIAYLMTVTDLGFNDAFRVLRSLHYGARPNSGFQQQLYEFEIKQLMIERYRLRKRFPNSNLYISDRLRCRAVLKDYELLLLERLRFNIDNREAVVMQSSSIETEADETNEDLGGHRVDNSQKKPPPHNRSRHTQQLANQRPLAARHLIISNAELNMEQFGKTFLLPGAVAYIAPEVTFEKSTAA